MLSLLNKNRSKQTRFFASSVIIAFWAATLALALLNRQNLIDWWRLRDYQPPVVVATLASQDTMTDFGRKVFYVNKPELTSKAEFGSVCPTDGGEHTIVLGCYHGGQSGIWLLDVSDPRLDGVEQVTAAHEMLHGAYERLSSNERRRVDGLLRDYYRHGLHDKRILTTIEAYKKSEPEDVVNEMHSIFGTEIAKLPAELEAYYQRYFTDRSKVVAFAAQYQNEFTSRQAAIAAFDAQIKDLRVQIDSAETDLQAKQTEINNQQAVLVEQRNSGNIAAYNAGVPAYNALVDSFNAEVGRIQSLITQHNQLVAERNAVALEEHRLLKDLSTKVRPIDD